MAPAPLSSPSSLEYTLTARIRLSCGPASEGWRLAFAESYLHRLPLTSAEIEAIPDLMRLARASSVLHRAARERMGTATSAQVQARAEALLRRDIWLEEHGKELVERLASSLTPEALDASGGGP